ncbi:MAG: hypothetical protein M1814_006376 [Vezdaea aestivalis]|nr:MAG: hypothetical protein M1814_006376 [Vezdaea aestivalis]
MAEELLSQARDALEGTIDFEGQRLAELLTTGLLGATGLAAFVAGAVKQDVLISLYTGLAGTAITFLIITPPWPFFNQNLQRWLPAQQGGIAHGITVDGKKVN